MLETRKKNHLQGKTNKLLKYKWNEDKITDEEHLKKIITKKMEGSININ